MGEETPRPVMLYVEGGMFMGKEMVFCKDCKYRKSMYPEPLDDRCTYWEKAEHSIHDDDFCSRGKRK